MAERKVFRGFTLPKKEESNDKDNLQVQLNPIAIESIRDIIEHQEKRMSDIKKEFGDAILETLDENFRKSKTLKRTIKV